MRRPGWTRPVQPPKAEGQARPGTRRDRLAVLLALVTALCLGAAFYFAESTQFLMPGRLSSAHGAIEKCSTCHTASGNGKLGWIHGLVAGDPLADSKACLTCHRMPDTAFNAHGASPEVLEQSTKRLMKIAAGAPEAEGAHVESVAGPTDAVAKRGPSCATCHQEHQGAKFKLAKISNEQCQTCHVVKFDSFDGNHPKFANYPFKKRTPIIYDHAGHFGKHFPEVAKKDPARRIPATCSSCHNSRADKRVMAVAPFAQTCSSCHLDQITGKERVSGPKGIAFLTLPGLDLQTLKSKNASIGEWPAASEAELTPFMKVMIGRNQRGRILIKAVAGLNLQDLSDASDDQIRAVTDLVWEIKRLFHALIWGKASDVLGDLNIGCGAKLSTDLVADLTASIPRDVVISAHQQWLPNLGMEMANRGDTSDQEQGCWIETAGGWVTTIAESGLAVQANQQAKAKAAPGAGAKHVRVDAHGSLAKGRGEEAEAPKAEAPRPEAAKKEASRTEASKAEVPRPKDVAGKTDAAATAKPGKATLSAAQPRQSKAVDQTDDLLNLTEEELRGIKGAEKAARPEGAAVRGYTAYAGPDGRKEALSADGLPPAMQAGVKDAGPKGAGGTTKITIAQAGGGKETASASKQPQARAADQTDDLLNPTEEELRGIAAPTKDAETAAQPDGAAPKPAAATAKPDSAAPVDAAAKAQAKAPADAPAGIATAAPQAKAAPVISIDSDVDPESWAVYGGWYRQDYTIFYRPTGHKDKFIYSWLFLTGPQAPKGDASPAGAVFDFLTSKDAQGSCTKCHSVDDIPGKGRVINFSPPSVGSKQGRFTHFIHEPHFGILETRGCLTCHSLEKGRAYLQSYEQGNPKIFMSNFGVVKNDLCQSCHTSSMARQDCLLCHKYHVNGVITPLMSTKIPAE
jgi:hypothetical protein